MALFDDFYQTCTRLARVSVPDGVGGYNKVWTEAGTFDAAVVRKNTALMTAAEVEGITYIYTVTTPVGVGLERGEYFKDSEGRAYRVTVDFERTHPAASFAFESCEAERTELK